MIKQCIKCNDILEFIELRMYGHTCEECEQKHHARIQAWRKGGEDKQLDEIYGTRP